jgi:hypothetical protein
MFIVLSLSDEYIAHNKTAKAAKAAGDEAAYGAALEKQFTAPRYKCCRGLYETEAEARAVAEAEDAYGIDYLFLCGEATDGNFAVNMGDNGWGFANESPSIAVGMFATREEAAKWANEYGSEAEEVFELDLSSVSVAA